MEGHNFLRTLLHFISIHNRYIQAGLMHIQKKYNFQKNKRRVSIISSKERLYFCKEISFYLQLKLNTSFLYKISHLTISSKAILFKMKANLLVVCQSLLATMSCGKTCVLWKVKREAMFANSFVTLSFEIACSLITRLRNV